MSSQDYGGGPFNGLVGPQEEITNEQIADKVMGWEVIDYDNGIKDIKMPDGEIRKLGSVGNYYDFLNDWNAMRLVIEKMRERGYEYACIGGIDKYSVTFGVLTTDSDTHLGRYADMFSGKNESLPLAVSEAALKALEASDE